MTKLFSIATHRAIEQAARSVLPEGSLMSRAASAIARVAEQQLRGVPTSVSAPVLVLAGPGDNGSDAMLAALLLADRGYPVSIFNAASAPDLSSLQTRILECCGQWNIPILARSSLQAVLATAPLVLDGLLGIGQNRPLSSSIQAIVALVNQAARPVLAIDVPTGINAQTGAVFAPATASRDDTLAIRAHCTLSLLGDKPGLHTGAAKDFVGTVLVDTLVEPSYNSRGNPPGNKPDDPLDPIRARDGERFDEHAALDLLPRRAVNSHKGSFGSVLIVGGSASMQGAALLAASGAQAGGAGKVFLCSPDQMIFAPTQAQWMSRAWPPALADLDAIVIGCGLSINESSSAQLQACWQSTLPLVLDAGALTWLSEQTLATPSASVTASALKSRANATVLTPHPLEAARLLGCGTAQVQADRISAANQIAQHFDSVVILKGAGSVIARPDGQWAIIAAGAPALATAGTGDVLAGLVAALLAQGLSAWDAARLAAFCHGRAGELIQQRLPRGTGLAAVELFEVLREVMNLENL